MTASRRNNLRRWIWTALAICLIWDGWLGEDAISPGRDWLGYDIFSRLIETRNWYAVWLSVAGLVVVQALLILALMRLPERRESLRSLPL